MTARLLLLLTLLFSVFQAVAQDDSPYARFGYEGKVLRTPQERQQRMMLLVPNTDTASAIAQVGLDPANQRYYLFDKQNQVLKSDTLTSTEVARFLSVDPLARHFAWNSSYAFAENRVIQGTDLEGKEYAENFMTELAKAAIQSPSSWHLYKPQLQVGSTVQLFKERSASIHGFIAIPSSLSNSNVTTSYQRNDPAYAVYNSQTKSLNITQTSNLLSTIEDAVSVTFHEMIHKDTDSKQLFPYTENVPTGDFEEFDDNGTHYKFPNTIAPSNLSRNEMRSYGYELGLNKTFTNVSEERLTEVGRLLQSYYKKADKVRKMEITQDLKPDGSKNE